MNHVGELCYQKLIWLFETSGVKKLCTLEHPNVTKVFESVSYSYLFILEPHVGFVFCNLFASAFL
jgi:hypothetical protein